MPRVPANVLLMNDRALAVASGSSIARRSVRSIARYLNKKFPPAQVGVLYVASLLMWVLCGQIARHVSLASTTVVASTTVTLLFLALRLFDDINAYYVSEGRDDIGGASLGGLRVGLVVVTLAIAVLNVSHVELLILSLADVLLMTIATVVLGLERRFGPQPTVRLLLGRLPLFELGPAIALAYIYVAWHLATSRSLSMIDVAAAIGVVWAAFDIWKLSRNMGVRPLDRHYDIPWSTVRWICEGLLILSLALVVILFNKAGFSVAYLVYATAVIVLFAVLARPRPGPESTRPAWVGLPYPTLMVTGLLVQLLIA